MFYKENRRKAEMYVNRHFSEIIEKLQNDGYFMYDEYETIYIHVGRVIPDILNRKIFSFDGEEFVSVEENIKGKGKCGIIIKKSMMNDRNKIISLLNDFYK